MSKHLDAVIRYRVINKLIKSKRYPSKNDLREACASTLGLNDVSPRTIDNDLRQMRENAELGYFAPIAWHATYMGYYYTDPHYSIDNVPLNNEDIDTLQLASNILSHFKGTRIFTAFGSTIDRLSELIRTDKQGSSSFDFMVFDNPGYVSGGQYLDMLIEAIQRKKPIQLSYQKFDTEQVKEYLFEAYFLKEYKSFWYVIGYVRDYNAFRTFALDRIKAISLIENDIFEFEHLFDKTVYQHHQIGVSKGETTVYKIQLQFSSLFSNYIKTVPFHTSQVIVEENINGCIAEYELVINNELITSLLGYGNQVKILSPEILKDNIKQTLSQSLANY